MNPPPSEPQSGATQPASGELLFSSVEALRQKLGEAHLSKVEAFQRAHKSEVLTVVFTDLV